MNQALEDLRGDIQTLIDTTANTITSLVDEMARRETPQLVGTVASDGSEFTSQIEELRSKVRAATDSLKQQTAAALAAVTSPAPAIVVTGASDTSTAVEQPIDATGVVVSPDSFKSGA